MEKSIRCIANGSGSRLYYSELELGDPTDPVALATWAGGTHCYVVELGVLWKTISQLRVFFVVVFFVVYERLEVSGWGLPPPRSLPAFYMSLICFLNVPPYVLSWLHFVPQRSTLQRNPIYNREKWKLGSSEGIVLVKFPTGLLTHRLCTGRKTQYNSHSTHFIRWDKTKGLTHLN